MKKKLYLLMMAILCLFCSPRSFADVTLSSEPVSASSISQGSTGNIVYIVKMDVSVTGLVATSMQFTLTGTHDNNDLTNCRLFTNTTPSLTGATNLNTVSAGFAAPHVYNVSISSQTIGAGATRYFIIVVDVSASGTNGNTVKIDGLVNPVTFGYTAAQTVTNTQTDAAGLKTIQAASVALSSEAVAASNITQGSVSNLLYIVKMDVTDLPITTSSLQFTLTGTHDNNDLTNCKIFTNTTPSLTGATNLNSVSAAFAAPHVYNVSISSQTIAAGATRYFLIVVDVSASGTNGNTVKLDGLANPVIFGYTTAPTITNNQTDAGGIKTIQAAGVTLSSEAVAGSNVLQGSVSNLVYIVKMDVTDLPITTNFLQVTLNGTHDNNDLTNCKIFINTTPSLTGATNLNSVSAAFAAPHIYNISFSSQAIAAGATRYFLIVVDVSASGTGGNTVKLDGLANPVIFGYTTAPTVTNNQTDVGGIKTIQAAGVTLSSEAVAGSNVLQGSVSNLVYIVKMDVTDLPITTNFLQVTLNGTHDNNDLTNCKVFINTTPSLTGATNLNSVSAAFAAPHIYNISFSNQPIAAGATRYFLIVVDVSASGTGGNTVFLDGAASPVIFGYTTAPTITNNQTDAGGIQTIQAAGVTLSSEAVAASNITQASASNLLYIVKMDVTDLPITTNFLQFTLTGTHDNNDLTNCKVFINTTPSLTGATNLNSVSAAFAAPHVYNISFSNQAIAAGTTRYFLIAVDVSASGTGGNTVFLDGAASPVIFSYTTAPTITNNQTDAGGIKTIQAAGVTLSSIATAASNIAQASASNLLYIVKMDVTDLPITTNAMQFTLTGTHDNNDLTNCKVFINTTPSLTGATNLNSVSAAFAAPHSYNVSFSSQTIAAGATRYFLIAVDVSNSGTNGNTVKLDGLANPVTFTYVTAPPITNNQTDAGGIKTIQAATVALSSEVIPASNIILGSNDNIIYMVKMDVTDLPVTVNGIQFTLTGTHDNDDLTNYAVFSNTVPALTGATQLASGSAAFAAPHTYNVSISNQPIAAGLTKYFIIAVDVNASGTTGNTVKLDGFANPVTFSYTTSPPVTNNQTDAAAVKTVMSTLPLRLISFTGNATSSKEVQLHWETAGEINTSSFEVEWSVDGSQFMKSAILQAAGNSIQNKQYHYLHKLPANGNNYYRLKMIDNDGRFTYSPVIKISITGSKTKLLVFPTPAIDIIQVAIQAVKNETITARLHSADGKTVASKKFVVVKGSNQFSWNLGSYQAGNYFISFDDKDIEPVRIIKL